MKKQFLKGVTMLAAIIVLAFATALAASAQTHGRQVWINIPFDFVVGEKTLTAGHYSVGAISSNSDSAIAVRSSDGRQKAIRLTNAVKGSVTERARLIFHRYGNTYFLAQVWAPGASEGREMSKSKAERLAETELAKNASKGELAQSGGPEVVTIVAEIK